VEALKRENQKLEAKNRKCEDTLNTVRENFTQVNEHFEEFTSESEKKRETFEKNTSTVLSDIKIEVRYLSVTLLDLNKHTLEIDRGISEMIEQKYEVLSNGLNSTLETFNKELTTTSNKMAGLDNLQQVRITSMFGKLESS
jgi:hypothetical protein